MAHIRKTKYNTFQATVYVGQSAELDKHGKPKKLYEYITCDTEKECRSKARELETEIENRSYSELSKMRFSDWCDKWTEISLTNQRPSTRKSYRMYISHHFKPYFERFKLKDITEIHIKEYLATKNKEGLSPTTIRKHFYILSVIMYDALKIKSPCRDIEAPSPTRYKPYILKEDEFNRIHEALKGTPDEIPLLLAAYCGMREGEIFALKWDDIDKKNCMIRVDETKTANEYKGYSDGPPKSERGIRDIAVPQAVIDLIENWRLKQKVIGKYLFRMRLDSYSKRFGNIIDDYNNALKVVRSKKAKRSDYAVKGYKRRIEFNLGQDPLPDIRFHDLRHYHATILHKHKISDQYAAERLGTDILVLKRIYQHLELDTKKQIGEQVKEIFK